MKLAQRAYLGRDLTACPNFICLDISLYGFTFRALVVARASLAAAKVAASVVLGRHFLYLSIYPSVYLSVYLSIYLPASASASLQASGRRHVGNHPAVARVRRAAGGSSLG